MTAALELDPTELHAAPPKLMSDARRGRPALDDVTDVFALAARIAKGRARAVTGLSVDEVRTMASVLTASCLVVHAAAALIARSDAGAAKAEMKRLLHELAAVTRPFMGEPS